MGSLAAGTADAASDVDLIICTRTGRFAEAWARRHELHATIAFPARSPINRSEMNRAAAHPVDLAFDDLKVALRRLAAGDA